MLFDQTQDGSLFIIFELNDNGFVDRANAIGDPEGLCPDNSTVHYYYIALGDFDFDLQDPASTPPDLEIGLLFGCETDIGEQELFWRIYDVDPTNDFALSIANSGFIEVNDPQPSFLVVPI
jgi:hypothetical protein